MSEPKEYRITLTVTKQTAEPPTYSAQWTDALGPKQPFTLSLPLAPADRDDLRWYLESYPRYYAGAGDQARAKAIETRLEGWGSALFECLFGPASGKGLQVYNNLMNKVQDGQAGVISINAGQNEVPEVLAQPWELLRDASGPLTFQGVTIRRQLQIEGRERVHNLALPLRLLLIVARPSDQAFIDPRSSVAPLLDALAGLQEQVQVEFCEPPTFARLSELLAAARRAQKPYAIVHFDGHGTYLPEESVGLLAFEDEQGRCDLVEGARLGDLLARQNTPLVVLEACRGADVGETAQGALAPSLLRAGVSSVIAFSHSVQVRAALLWVAQFYRELARGQTIGAALEEARVCLHGKNVRQVRPGPAGGTLKLQDWFLPQLYQANDNLALFPPANFDEQDAGRIREALHRSIQERLHGFPPQPRYLFHGRAGELHALLRAFRRQPAILLSGMGGMGKTALARELAAWGLRSGRWQQAIFHSFESKTGAERAAQVLGQALEGEAFSARPAEEQWAAAIRLFRETPVLLVWDNFESTLPEFQPGDGPPPAPAAADPGGTPPAPAESLLSYGALEREKLLALYRALTEPAPGGALPTGRLLITCRPEQTFLPGPYETALEGLDKDAALELLGAIVEKFGIDTRRRGDLEQAELAALLRALAYHPLSIELVAPHLKHLSPEQIHAEFGALVEQVDAGNSTVDRNRSLRASLAFSTRRLSPPAQAALPWLSLFEGGVFEAVLLEISQIDPAAWSAIRAQLEGVALLRVEAETTFGERPFLRFHPTLPFAAGPAALGGRAPAEERFVAVYYGLAGAIADALRGAHPSAGMAAAALEEPNLRRAAQLALQAGQRQAGWEITNTLRRFLELAARLSERDRLVAWLKAGLGDGPLLDAAACDAARRQAWSRFQQGQPAEALQQVQELIERLQAAAPGNELDEEELRFQLATSQGMLGRILDHSGRSEAALAPLAQAEAGYSALQASPKYAAHALGNLAAVLGDQANALSSLGRHAQAQAAAERGLAINRQRGDAQAQAVGLARMAGILAGQQRYAEAGQRCGQALAAAQAAGDRALQAGIIQSQGSLEDDQGHFDEAIALYQQALGLFQAAGDAGGELNTANLLGVAERNRGQLAAAEAWYRRARELAGQLRDQRTLADVAQNQGILYQQQAGQPGLPEAERAALLRRALASLNESLAIEIALGNAVGAASSYFQLGRLHLLLGELPAAEQHARQGLAISEALDLPEVYKDYRLMADIARARGDSAAAAEWQAKCDAKLAVLKKRRKGE